MVLIGTEIAKMHLADVIHSDLTTSNMMLHRASGQLVRNSRAALPFLQTRTSFRC
jgi:tRNA A-37 threonylcarbamoyl transferase component Bud32